ncbi:MAG: hypothetical protein PHS79_03310 [Patescibacteria group bacterium]|nr:hypothetical protein [Patescibacteria group bacterium]
MVKKQIYNSFSDLPMGVQDFFLRNVDDVYNSFIDGYSLPEDKFFDGFDAPVLDSVMGLATFDEAMKKVGEFLTQSNIDVANQSKIIEHLLKHVYWPLREMFGKELMDFIELQKIDVSAWPQTKILYKPISYNGAVSELVNRLRLYSAGGQMREKLKDLLVSLIKGTRVPDQIKTILMQASEAGGLGFDAAAADKSLVAMQDLIKSVKILDEQEYQDYLTEELRGSDRTTSGSDGEHGTSYEVRGTPEDDEQIATIKAAMPSPPKTVTELEKAVEATYERIPDKPKDAYLSERLRHVISSRLRDVRNSIELMSLLQRDSKVGGLDLDKPSAEAWSKIIEDAYTEFHAKIEMEEKGKLEIQLTEQKKKIEEKRLRESEEHNKWYEEKIKKQQSADVERNQIAQAWKKGFDKAEAHPVDIKNAAVEKKKYGELINVQRTTYDVPSSANTPTVKVSAVTAEMSKQAKPSIVDGVKPVAVPKLHGLSDELSGMTLAGFRRLGKTPADSAAKIKQRLDTLGEEGFEYMAAGTKSWQSSPIMKMYMDLVMKSFAAGKPIGVLSEERRQAGEDVLTKDEIEVLINLNNSLHY